MSYHKKTLEDLQAIADLQVKIGKLNREIASIRSRCTHKDYILTTTESLAYEYTPVKRCIVCNREHKQLKDAEREEIVRKHYHFMEMDCTPEQVADRLQGWNSI